MRVATTFFDTSVCTIKLVKMTVTRACKDNTGVMFSPCLRVSVKLARDQKPEITSASLGYTLTVFTLKRFFELSNNHQIIAWVTGTVTVWLIIFATYRDGMTYHLSSWYIIFATFRASLQLHTVTVWLIIFGASSFQLSVLAVQRTDQHLSQCQRWPSEIGLMAGDPRVVTTAH